VDDIIVESKTIALVINQKHYLYNRIELPKEFLNWQSTARLNAFQMMADFNSEKVRTMPAHLPVLATFGTGDFPVNLTSRGIGLLPKEEFILPLCELIEKTISESKGQPWQDTLPKRLAAIQSFYEKPEGQTVENLKNNPKATLLYSGEAPKFPSYQMNGIMRFIYPGDIYFRFLLAARELFANDAFHIHQVRYPFGYLFYPTEIKNKTPFPRR
jgi:hypothetical protein